jgi:hypothetical protein
MSQGTAITAATGGRQVFTLFRVNTFQGRQDDPCRPLPGLLRQGVAVLFGLSWGPLAPLPA